MATTHRLTSPRKILVKDLNDYLTCNLCGGYLIDATAVIDCSHTFCRACIVRHFESSRFCPNCDSLVHKSKPLSKLRSDTTLQSLIYKAIPALYSKELQRRADFYHSTGFRANSSCSDDSVLGDRTQDSEEWVHSNIGDPSLYFSPDDSVSLSVEYYTVQEGEPALKIDSKSDCLKSISTPKSDSATNDIKLNSDATNGDANVKSDSKPSDNDISARDSAPKTVLVEHLKTDSTEPLAKVIEAVDPPDIKDSVVIPVASIVDNTADIKETTNSTDLDLEGKESSARDDKTLGHKRFLQCPAAVKMVHLMKFLRMKFALSKEHRVDIIYAGEVLPPYLSLMDVAYTFKWNRAKPMRFFYLIYIPIMQPPPHVKPELPKLLDLPPPVPIQKAPTTIKIEPIKSDSDFIEPKEPTPANPIKLETVDIKKENNNNLKLKCEAEVFIIKLNGPPEPPAQPVDSNSETVDGTIENCVYDYTEPDKDEIKAFAERRDREWALQKQADTLTHISKKRKKNKHAKNEFMHKKRKLHAEITSSDNPSKTDDSLKLKVKLSVPNGHKHKHRSNPSLSIAKLEPPKAQELSPKERLLQMRQVRHKNIPASITEDKPKPIVPELAKPSLESNIEVLEKVEPIVKPPELLGTSKTLRSDFTFKTSMSKDICNKYVRINLEKCTDAKVNPVKKPGLVSNLVVKTIEKIDKPLEVKPAELNVPVAKLPDKEGVDKLNITEGKIDKSTEKPFKTVEPIKPVIDESKSIENKLNNIDFKSAQNSTLVTKNFTVSKVEQGVKRKLEPPETSVDKRPSLEITVINVVSLPGPTTVAQSSGIQSKSIPSTQTKSISSQPKSISSVGAPPKKIRPPPLTIPLGRIKEMNLKSNLLAAKAAEKCDIFGALDLSAKPSKELTKPEFRATASPKPKSVDQLRATASPRPKPVDQLRSSASPKLKIADQQRATASPRPKLDQIRSSASPRPKLEQVRPKPPLKVDLKAEPTKPGEKKPNISNLQLLSESAVQIREMMVKNSSTISPIPNLIKKLPNPIGQNSGLKSADFAPKLIVKTPNLIAKLPNMIAKTPNFIPKSPNFLPKNLQKLPKLNEINKTQFARLNTSTQQIRTTRPAGQNQSIRNIPNPSLLVRQQNQNRINSMATSAASSSNGHHDVKDVVKLSVPKPQVSGTETSETEKKPAENKASEPPPLKPIEGYKK